MAALTRDHAAFIQELLNTEGWLRFIGQRNVHSAEEAGLYIDKIDQNPAIKYWVVSVTASQQPVGIITLIRRDYLDFPDLGFAFLPESGGSGYALEASQVILNYLRDEGISAQLLAATMAENTSSIRLLNNLGFQFERPAKFEDKEKLLYRIDLQKTEC